MKKVIYLVPYFIKAVIKNKKIWTAIKLDWLMPATRHLSSDSNKQFRLVGLVYFLLLLTSCDAGKEQQAAMTAQLLEHGKQLYRGNGCAVCHGKSGRGDGPSSKNSVPTPTNFHDSQAFRIETSVNDIKLTVKEGTIRHGGAMPAFDHLTEQELHDIAVFLKSLQSISKSTLQK